MRYESENRMFFEPEDLDIPPVTNPAYIYKEGDEIQVLSSTIVGEQLESVTVDYKVVDVKHEISCIIASDQNIIVHLEKKNELPT
uniref:Uncharacterized protein n=1 Tax=viral metagenome TaxID=1070528 RepID=A0A6H1ZE79_9ZZZZ